ncbi:Poly(A)-specific ribonuclease PARN [Apostasia shenzhenica]|uniref:Poly(A)-specific ribonuclease PARN n=1 Tax=Apostasia shenzhenica TaxID=1088818 RepID=A0A2I0A7P0_9ASPA|nr:Poly(A)-specific ribonuclease PARN [Apostasia shenzhenica]
MPLANEEVMACFGLRVLSKALTQPQARHLRRALSSSTVIGGNGGVSGVAVKRVTISNFWSVLDDLRVRVREADFVAVDLEMTGVTSAPWRQSFEFDRSDVRYFKVKDSVEKFAVVQFGVCTFQWDASLGSFIAHPAQEVEALKNLGAVYDDDLLSFFGNFKDDVEIPIASTTDLLFMERMKIRFHEWRENLLRCSENHAPEGSSCGSKMQFQTVFLKKCPAVLLNGFTSHQLRLIQLVIRKHFKDLLYVRVSGDSCSWQKLVVYVNSQKDIAILMEEIKEDQRRSKEEKVHLAVGFRHIVDIFISEKKLIVGYNCFLDIAHIYDKFVGPLPCSKEDFVMSLHKIFPYVIDTKHLINANHVMQYLMKRSKKSLSSAFAILCPKIYSGFQDSTSVSSVVKVHVQADETGSSYWNSGAKHEAGFDAFMTGCVFAQACSHLGIKFDQESVPMDLPNSDRLQTYINILFHSRAVIDLRTGAESLDSGYKRKYPKIEFSKIALIWGFSSKLRPNDMQEILGKVFGTASVLSVFYIDGTAALIQFSKEEFVDQFLVLKDTLEKDDGPISLLHPLAELLVGGETRAANYDAYGEICSSSAMKFSFAGQAEAIGIKWKTRLRTLKEDKESPLSQVDNCREQLYAIENDT